MFIKNSLKENRDKLQHAFSSYIYDISAIALLLLPLTLTNSLCVLLGQGFAHANYATISDLLIQLSHTLINFYPLALCVLTSYYLSHKTSINSGAFIVYAIILFYSLSHANNLYSPVFHLPNNTILALVSPILTLIYCKKVTLRDLVPHSLDFPLAISLHVARFSCFAILVLGLSTLSKYIFNLSVENFGEYRLNPLTWSGGLLYQTILGLLGSIGINGHNFLLPIKQMLYQATEHNLADAHAGIVPVNIVSQGFYDAFLSMGGSGNSICLLFCILLFSQNRNHTMLALAALPMVVFNINEVLLFGLPIIFNPLLIIPFIFVPLISFGIAYFAISIGLVNPIITTIDWMTPPLLSGYIAMGNSIDGSLLQLFIITIGIYIYKPFYISFAGTGINERNDGCDIKRITLGHLLAEIRSSARNNQERAKAQIRVEGMVKKGKFLMYYQCQESSSNSPLSVEALIRYLDESGELCGPSFISDFQQLDAMPMLDYIVIDLVLADMQKMPLNRLERVALNISASTFSQRNFVCYLTSRIEFFEVAPNKIEIEITEETLLDNTVELSNTIKKLQSLGINVAMDDFGAGFASFPHLMKYPFDKVKLDRSLLKDCSTYKGQQLYKLLVQIGNLAKCQVLAEGVETEWEKDFVISCGVKRIQGYQISRPEPLAKFLDRI
ncbi:PTS sugar transporter subunit IIC/EAL domain-containing protein [Aeromonas hydrophila]